MVPDIATLIESGISNPWVYLPLTVVLGALHALEPGHSKSVMAAFIVATRGTPAQAALLGLSSAIGHTIVVWALAAAGLYFGDRLILDKAEPILLLISGLLVMILAVRVAGLFHHHHHDHDHGDDVTKRFAGKHVGTGDIIWFGLTGGLLPCPSALAVLLVCLQAKAFVLGFAMVAGFSVGLAITLVSVGIMAAWGARKASEGWSGFSKWSERLPYFSAAIVFTLGLVMTVKGINGL